MKTVYLGLGGNLLTPYLSIKKALQLLENSDNISVSKKSSFYLTSPVSEKKQEDYINMVCCIKTTLTPIDLLKRIEKIEIILGKKPKAKDDPRIIDIDILFYGREKVNSEKLTIPHPEWQNRLFVLVPLAEITTKIEVLNSWIDIKGIIQKFPYKDEQKISLYNPKDIYEESLHR